MRKQVKLPPPQKAQAPKKSEDKGGFVFFVGDQGEGAGKTAVIVLKILELILTTIFAVVPGLIVPLLIRFVDGFVDAEVASDPSSAWWFGSSIAYIIGLFALMLGKAKIATVIHVIASVGTFVTYHYYTKLYEGYEGNGPTVLYMPCLFITMLTIAIMLIINVPKWVRRRVEKESEAAPSILGGDDVGGKR